MEVIWKPIVNFEGLYIVSNIGDVVSLGNNKFNKKRVLTKFKDQYGYLLVSIYKEKITYRKRVHRLVAESFIENPQKKPTVNHKNGIKDDNRLENLEWATKKEQTIHSYTILHRLNGMLGKRGKLHWRSKVIIQATLDGKELNRFESSYDVERKTGFNAASVRDVCRGKGKTAYGFVWYNNK
jgi:hypothetical protein